MFGGEPDEPVERPGEEFARGHYEQLVEATGTVQVGDDRWELHGFGLRDHSWGPRYWQAPWYYRWLTGNVGEDFGFMGSRIARRDGAGHPRRIRLGRRRRMHLCRDFRIRSTWEGDARYHRDVEAELVTDARTWMVRGSVLWLIPLRNRRTDPDGNRARHPHLRRAHAVDPRRRTGRLRAVGVPRPDRRRVTGRPGRIGPWIGPRSTSTRSGAASGWPITRPSSVPAQAFGSTDPDGRAAHRPGMWGRSLHGRSRGSGRSASMPPGRCSTVAGCGPGCAARPGRPRGASVRAQHLARWMGEHELPPRAQCPASRCARPICTAPSSVGAPVEIQVLAGDYEGAALADGSSRESVLRGRGHPSGSATSSSVRASTSGTSTSRVTSRASGAVRARTLPDVVGPGMRLLVVGLNPSIYSADVGVGYARPGNRFWPAARGGRPGDTRPRPVPRAGASTVWA